jgi:hypothetical protein
MRSQTWQGNECGEEVDHRPFENPRHRLEQECAWKLDEEPFDEAPNKNEYGKRKDSSTKQRSFEKSITDALRSWKASSSETLDFVF